MAGVERAVGKFRNLRAVPEGHVAMQVHVVVLRRVLVRAEGGELAGLVVRVGDLVVVLPHRPRDLGFHERLDRRLAEYVDQVGEDLLSFLLVFRVLPDDRMRLRVPDGLTLRVLVGLVRAGEAVAHQPGIDRPTGVDVRFAEAGVAIGVVLNPLRGPEGCDWRRRRRLLAHVAGVWLLRCRGLR